MDRTSALFREDHSVTVIGNHPAGDDVEGGHLHGSVGTLSNTQGDISISVSSHARGSSTTTPPRSTSLSVSSLRRVLSLGRNRDFNTNATRQRPSPLNSGLWISIELIIILSQIIASVIILILSKDENPHAPLAVWIIGYAGGCLATLPFLYWRYAYLYVQQSVQDSQTSSVRSPSYFAWNEAAEGRPSSARRSQIPSLTYLRMGFCMERFKIALDCFFAVWFVVGNVWVFGGHASSNEAPNLYRLCIVFLTFCCIGYAMPFILCVTICCCLPCIITLLGLRENSGQAMGASSEIVTVLQTYKFKSKGVNGDRGSNDGNDSDSEDPGEGGFIAAGTDKERAVFAEDAVCCICLAKYRDNEVLRELPCMHFFHVECVDKWLKISASCPLCKHDLVTGGLSEQSVADTSNQMQVELT